MSKDASGGIPGSTTATTRTIKNKPKNIQNSKLLVKIRAPPAARVRPLQHGWQHGSGRPGKGSLTRLRQTA
eukprot:8640211-Pyramimonas_sp.AAC.1